MSHPNVLLQPLAEMETLGYRGFGQRIAGHLERGDRLLSLFGSPNADPAEAEHPLLHAVVLAALVAHDPLGALICFVSVIVANMFVNAWFSYSHHAGLSLKDRYGASYSNLSRLENLLTFNTGYHTAHHVRASVHWYELPTFHTSIAARVPAHCYLSGELTHGAAVAQLARTLAAEAAGPAPATLEGAMR